MVDKGSQGSTAITARKLGRILINEQVSLPRANMSCCSVCCLLCCVVFCESGCLSRLYFYEQLLIYRHGVFMGQALRTLGDVRGVWTVLSCGYVYVDIFFMYLC